MSLRSHTETAIGLLMVLVLLLVAIALWKVVF